jgi:hypothetical protein
VRAVRAVFMEQVFCSIQTDALIAWSFAGLHGLHDMTMELEKLRRAAERRHYLDDLHEVKLRLLFLRECQLELKISTECMDVLLHLLKLANDKAYRPLRLFQIFLNTSLGIYFEGVIMQEVATFSEEGIWLRQNVLPLMKDSVGSSHAWHALSWSSWF